MITLKKDHWVVEESSQALKLNVDLVVAKLPINSIQEVTIP